MVPSRRRMSLPSSIRSAIPLVIGLLVGGVGVALFMDSLPGKEGSPQERANDLELELKRAQHRIAALEAAASAEQKPRTLVEKLTGGSRGGADSPDELSTLTDGARRIAEDIREGRPVNPDDIFQATKPLIRDLSPLFDRMRVKTMRSAMDSTAGELARKYKLTPQGEASLKQWFDKKAEEEAKRWSDMVGRPETRLDDLMRASMEVRPDEGLDGFMPGVLSADQLATFRADRMAERVKRVEQEADMKMQRLNGMVDLDEAQRDQVFGIMARGSREYDPAMVLEGVSGGELGPTPSGNKQAAMLAILRPDQRAAYEAERQRRRDEANKEMESIGLKLPPAWELLDDGDFR